VATVGASGLVRAHARGTATIVATDVRAFSIKGAMARRHAAHGRAVADACHACVV
jgi:hypothetical protein